MIVIDSMPYFSFAMKQSTVARVTELLNDRAADDKFDEVIAIDDFGGKAYLGRWTGKSYDVEVGEQRWFDTWDAAQRALEDDVPVCSHCGQMINY